MEAIDWGEDKAILVDLQSKVPNAVPLGSLVVEGSHRVTFNFHIEII